MAWGSSTAELTEMFNRKFGLELKQSQIKSFLSNHGVRTGHDTRFKPGQQSHNKGKRGYYAAGAEKGWFKSGQMPQTYRPVGSERVNVDGYVEVKIADPKTWRAKHVVIWEQAHGPVPKGHVVIFGDGNRLNSQLANLILVSRSQLAMLNKYGLIGASVEFTKAGVTVADLHLKVGERKREQKGTNSNDEPQQD